MAEAAGSQSGNNSSKGSVKKKIGKTVAAVTLSAFFAIVPVISVILLPALAIDFISGKVTEIANWVSWWGSDYTLEDFKHEDKDGNVSYYPTETDFVDLAIKSELNELSSNIYKGHSHTGESLSLSEAIKPFDEVYADIAVSLSNSFEAAYASGSTKIVTNSDYYHLTKDSVLNMLTAADEGSDTVMWSEGQVYDEYLGIYGKKSIVNPAPPSNIRKSWRQKTGEDDIPEVYNLISRWMYATMRVDDSRFITDEEQEKAYGSEPDAYRETAATPGTNPLFYMTRRQTKGSGDGTDSSESGGSECSRLKMTNDVALKTASYLASGTYPLATMHYGDFNGKFRNLLITSADGEYAIGSSPIVRNNRGRFLKLEIIDPDEEINGKKIPAVRYDPKVMANMNNVVGCATISDIYGSQKTAWSWYDKTTVTKDTLLNVSGFYVYRDEHGKDHICYAGANYNANDKSGDTHGYASYQTWDVQDNITGWRSVWNDDAGSLKKAVDTEIRSKFSEALDPNSADSKAFKDENAARQAEIDEQNRIFEAAKKAAEDEYNQKLQEYTDAQNAILKTYETAMYTAEDAFHASQDTVLAYNLKKFNKDDELTEAEKKYWEIRNFLLINCVKPNISVQTATGYLDNALKYYRGETMSQSSFNIYDRAFKAVIDENIVKGNGRNINDIYYRYNDYMILVEEKEAAAASKREYDQLVNTMKALEQKFYDAANAYSAKSREVDKNIREMKKSLKAVRDNKITQAENKRDSEIEKIKNRPFEIKLKTKIIWYDTSDCLWYGYKPDISGGLYYSLAHVKEKFTLSSWMGGDRYPNIKEATYSYGDINIADSTGAPNIVSFHAQYTSHDGTVKTLPENHLVCYRIVYQDSLLQVPPTRNNRYNFSSETDANGNLVHGASAKPIVEGDTLEATLDIFDDYDHMSGDDTTDPTDPDYEFVGGYTLKQMLTKKTWLNPRNNWRTIFELESDSEKEKDK